MDTCDGMVIETMISLLGHKDHGKSTLIGRILYETKSLTEDRIEEAREICRKAGKEFELAFLLGHCPTPLGDASA